MELDGDDERDAEVDKEVDEEEEDEEEAATKEYDSEEDAEGSEEEEVDVPEVDADGVQEDGEDEEDEDHSEVVGPVKARSTTRSRRKMNVSDDSDEDDDEEDEDGSEESDGESQRSAEEDWEADEREGEDGEIGTAMSGHCVFCHQDEEHDPSEEYEEYLACAVCGDNAHRQCAREEDFLSPDEDGSQWRCKECVTNGLEADFKDVPGILSSRRRSSAPRMARDLLPSARGGIKPDSHSVFNTLILDEDPMDGTRSLRKRKTPDEDIDEVPRHAEQKRRRTDASGDQDEPDAEAVLVASGVDATNEEETSSPRSRSHRPQRNQKRKQGARFIHRSEDPQSAIFAIPITLSQWDEIEKNVLRKQKRRERDRLRRIRNQRPAVTIEAEEPTHFPVVQTSMYTNPFYAFPDRETDETKGRPYGGILTDAEADTARTYPQDADRHAFQDARNKAEEQWKQKAAQVAGETPARSKSYGQASKIKCINFGQYEIDTWHAAPYPEEYSRNKHLYICEFCLKYMNSDYVAWRHKLKCPAKHPPGDEIYRNKIINPETGAELTLSFFEVDGRRNPLYCQNLCLLAKLFLGSKTLYYDVEPFLFYIMTENDEFGCHFVGYFSKEKRGAGPPPPMEPHTSFDDNEAQTNGGGNANEEYDPLLSNPGNNVSCILVLPVYMRRGFGRVMIEFSYMLTQVEGKTGSPEKPLSDMGLVSYRSYWRGVLCKLLLAYKDAGDEQKISIAQIAKQTGMTPDDIISTLEALRFLVKDPFTSTYALRLDYDYMREYVEKHDKKATVVLDPRMLCWTPYVMGRPTNYFTMGEEANQPMQTVAPREEADTAISTAPEGEGQEIPKPKAESTAEGEESLVPTTEHPDEPATNGVASEDLSKKVSPPAPVLTANAPPPLPPLSTTSPHKPSPHKTPNGTHPATTREASPSSLFSGSQHTSASSIPPTRFEIFPPVPGMLSSARRAGRPPRRGKRSGNGTPVRRSTAAANAARMYSPSAAARALRRTRSSLAGAPAISAADEDEEAQDGDAVAGAEDEEMGDGHQQAAGDGGEEDEDEDAEGEAEDDIKYE